MVNVLAAFPNTSRDEVRETLRNADPGVVKWVDTWLDNRQIAVELDRNSGSLCSRESGLWQGSPLLPVLFGLTCRRIIKELLGGCSYVYNWAWSIPFDSLSDKNELASIVQRLLNKIQAVSSRNSMELDKKKTEFAVIYKTIENANHGKWKDTGGQYGGMTKPYSVTKALLDSWGTT
jgi:hypothetical protein